MATQPQDGLEAWRLWIEQNLPGQDGPALLALVEEGAAGGLAPEEVVALLRRSAGRGGWQDQQVLELARYGLSAGLHRLGSAGAAETRADLEARWQAGLRLIAAVAGPAPAVPAAAGRSAAPARPAGPAFSWRRFFGDHAIQLLGYSGAFLLGIAVLLYDLSGQSPGRFYALAALDLALFGAAYLASHTSLLQVLSRAYTAMAAVLLPLTLFGAYVFLALQGRVAVLTALAVGAAICAATYGYLALALQERAYGWISVVAAEAAVLCAVQQAWPAGWAGAAVAVCGLLLIAAEDGAPAPFVSAARWLGPVSAGLGAVAVLVIQVIRVASRPGWALPAALAVAVAAYGLFTRREARAGLRWLPAYAATALVASIAWQAGATRYEWQWVLLALAAADVAAGRRWARFRWVLEVPGAILLAIALAIAVPGDAGAEAIFHAVALAGAIATVAIWRSDLGAGYATVILVLGWYWAGTALLPRPPHPGPDDLVKLYSPLPLLLAAAGAGLRTVKPGLRLAPYAGFGAVGLFVAVGAGTADDLVLAGGALIVYSVLAYALLLWERRPVGALALAGVLIGSWLLAGSRSVEGPQLVLLLAIWSAGMMLAAGGFRSLARLEWASWHRYLGLAGLAAATIAGAAVAWTGPGGGGLAETGLSVAIAAAGLAFDWLQGHRESFYGAIVAASALAVPVAVAAGLTDPQWRLDLAGVALVAAGALAAGDGGLRSPRLVAVLLQVAGVVLLFGLTGGQVLANWGGAGQWPYTELLAIEGVAALIAGVAVRSRWPAFAGGLGLVLAALSALFLLAAQLPLSAIFGILAAVLIGGATGLALLRGRIRSAGATPDWGAWL